MSRPVVRVLAIRAPAARLAALAALCAVTFAILAGAVRAAPAAPAGPAGTMAIGDVGGGALLFRTVMAGRYVPAPLVATEVDMRVGGMVARVVVRQQFHNPTAAWLEGVYAFPLPDDAAVDGMRLSVGERVIEAKIAERAAARRSYEKARREGRRAALVTQRRPNIFTNSVANIGPGEAVTVELRYQQTLRYGQGRFRLRFPMVVAPRYVPRAAAAVRAAAGAADGDGAAADARGIGAPVLHPDAGVINPVTLKIALDAGFPLAELASAHHRIAVTGRRDGRATVTLADGAVPADRDFELTWTPETGRAPAAALFRETVAGDTYLLAMVLPPHGDGAAPAAAVPRDAVFVIDRSGSMAGASIRQAREALLLALDRLRPVDRFNIIRFDDATDGLFPGLRPAGAAAIARARAFVRDTEAEGGTEMLPALRRALSGGRDAGRLRQVVFLTDGAVGNEAQLMDAIARRLDGSRLFTVGIGSAPNGYFMRKAAEAGRGSFTHIGDLSQVAARMDGLFRKLERPVLTGLTMRWQAAGGADLGADAYPRLPPDLYDGEPVVVVARMAGESQPDAAATLRLAGSLGGREWRHALALGGARPAAGIAALWGRARIAELMDSLRRGADAKAVRRDVIATALRHRLVSRYTSLVAVAKERAHGPGLALIHRKVPHNLPHGWVYDKVFGGVLKKAQPARLRRAGLDAPAGPTVAVAVDLPQGATRARLDLLIGLGLLLLAAGILLWRRRIA